MKFDTAGQVMINETANANMTIGLTIQQGANDDEILAFKSSDVAHAWTAITETDTYAYMAKASAAYGGLAILGIAEDDASASSSMIFYAYGGTADTTKSTAGTGLVTHYIAEHDGANAIADITADGNMVAYLGRVSSAWVARWILDEDGDTWQSGNITLEDNTDSAATTDQVVLGAYDLSAGNRALSISQEAAVAADTDETKFSNKLPVRINGTTYYIMLTTT
jgi:hypothetical protein